MTGASHGAITVAMAKRSLGHTELQQLLGSALGAHQQGKLGEAERLYSEVLKAEPAQFDALHFLGILRHQQGRSDEALTLIDAALKARPDSAQALSNRGLVRYALRRASTRRWRCVPISSKRITTAAMRCSGCDAMTRRWRASRKRCGRGRILSRRTTTAAMPCRGSSARARRW
jgi:tetratricopeptide (TPR) repeat protein